ncbi:Phospho-N-acetylmuramoyl-pentapeptide-transferase [Methanobrevibacter gottschalkii]|uniref:Phospho-N-acetylmuramoyl-pentapeptide-transferase n=3 Tax=Methanobacteriaceae TaxID=2159 RepID=A0A3N5C237_9EURY|nr:phospho-N-acetylmuramoyl-pentapeptide-transferase [Methanobrevibacter sp. A27]RPF50241.1 phospho-N-acetylmuramoyl-pentapeptide-transferase [Methanobrevibacter gottschalkii DSM 11977]SEL14196.1 Phospho-N-acetylmuramoyl-pentapeptide-transferase [Methanobrevibacter gottschalkii]
MNNTDMLILFLITLCATIFFTWYIKRILIKARIADNPIVSEHRHKSGTPTMGGIAFLFTISLIIALYYQNTPILLVSFIMLAGGIVGLVDDLIGLKVKEVQKIVVNTSSDVITLGRLDVEPNEEVRVATPKAKAEVDDLLKDGKVEVVGEVPIKTEPGELEKIICQIVLGLFFALTGIITAVGGFKLGVLAIPVVVIAILGSINSINLIDGMDGLAAGIVGIASIACCVYGYLFGPASIIPPFLILSGLCLGFLVFNKHPASIFMGDTGSFVLGTGYAAAVLVCDIPYFGVLALGVPIISVVVSLLHRAHIIKLPVEPLHHTLNHYGMSETRIIVSYWGITFLLCIIGILAKMYVF